MKIPFSKNEVGSMVLAALEEGYDPLAQVTDLLVHKGALSKHIITLTTEDGSELKLTPRAVEVAIVAAFNRDAAPVIIRDPEVKSISFHQSEDAMAKVEVVSGETESRLVHEEDED